MSELTDKTAELAQITTAITHILSGGQEYTITSGSGMGSSRVVKLADIESLFVEKRQLEIDIKILSGSNSATRFRAGW
jgi:hypothetical protein